MGWQKLCAIGLVCAQVITQDPGSKIHWSRYRARLGLEHCKKEVKTPTVNDNLVTHGLKAFDMSTFP